MFPPGRRIEHADHVRNGMSPWTEDLGTEQFLKERKGRLSEGGGAGRHERIPNVNWNDHRCGLSAWAFSLAIR